MILGVGLDLCRVARIAEAHARFGQRFLARCYTPAEAAAALARSHPARALAMRFAAKEAFSKAAGLGFKGLAPVEIEVAHDARGKPSLILHGRAQAWAQTHGLASSHLSLTDEGEYAAAVVVLEK
jgi:holo-[acyl-carrier protein] synthase